MKKIITIFTLSFAAFSAIAKPASVLHIDHWVTKKGLDVFFNRQESVPSVNANLIFDAGSSRDSNHPGLSNLTSSLLGEDAKGMSSDEIANAFANVGAGFSSDAGRDFSSVSFQSLTNKKYYKNSLKLFYHVLSTPQFLEKNIKRVKAQIDTEIGIDQQEPNSVAMDLLFENLYKHEPYAHPVTGSKKDLSVLNRNNIVSFYKQYYVDKNADLILVGDISKAQAKVIANKISSVLPEGVKAKTLNQAKPFTHAQTVKKAMPLKQTTVLLATTGVNYQNKNYAPLFIGNYLLGGSSLHSLLNNTLREKKGLVYGVNSNFSRMALTGPFFIWFQTQNSQTNKAISLTKTTLKHFLNFGVSEDKFNAAKKSIIGRFPLAFASNASIMSMINTIAFYRLSLDYLDHYRERIQKVTQDQMLKAMRQKIKLNNMLQIEVG